MAIGSTATGEWRKDFWRRALRALNGAAMGLVAGGILGYLLAALSIIAVNFNAGAGPFSPNWWQALGNIALFGGLPGVPAGGLIGSMVIIRSDRHRLLAALGIGSTAGLAYAALWYNAFHDEPAVLVAMIASGVAGGLLMAGLLRLLRHYWKWWRRWEADGCRG